jgi:hypothetical protein
MEKFSFITHHNIYFYCLFLLQKLRQQAVKI